MEHFTKEQAAFLLGETVTCKEPVIKTYPDLDQSLVLFGKGDKSDVVLIEHHPDIEGIYVSLLVDGDYLPFHKEAFNRHCLLLQPVELSDAHSVEPIASVA